MNCVSEDEKDYELKEELEALEIFGNVFFQDSFFCQFLDDPTYVENYEVIKFMEIIESNKGIVFIWGHGMFLYEIDENGRVEINVLNGGKFFKFLKKIPKIIFFIIEFYLNYFSEANYWDSVYFRNDQIIYFYEEDNFTITEFDLKTKTFTPVYKLELYDGCSCRQLSKSKDEEFLIMNSNDKTIHIFHKKNPNSSFNFHESIIIHSSLGNEIRSIKSLKLGHIVSISANGFLSVYRINSAVSTYSTVKMIKLPLTVDEEVSSIAVGSRDDFISIATTLNLKPHRIFVFKLQDGILPCYAAEMNLSQEYYAECDLGFFQDLNMDFYIGDNPVIIACQYDGDNLAIPFVFDGEDIGYLTNPKIYHSNVFCRFSFFDDDQSLWSIDKNGTIKYLKMAVDEEDEE